MIPLIYGYARVSKLADEGTNLETQLHQLNQYGLRDEMIFRDVGTGRNQERAGWQSLMAQVRTGDTIVVCTLDRMSRDFDGSVAIQADLTKRGIGIVALKENIDTRERSTASDNFFRRLMVAEGAYQVESTSERIRAGLARARANGKQVGRPAILTGEQVKMAKRLRSEEGASWRYLAKLFGCHRATIKRAVEEERA